MNLDPEVRYSARSWKIAVAGILALYGLGASLYLTIAHFHHAALTCPGSGGAITCEAVTTSGESYFLHIPVAILGLGFYVIIAALNTPWAWRASHGIVHLARLATIALGMGFAIWLISAELLIVKKICLWCTSVHVATFLLFVLIVTEVPTMLGWGVREEA